MKVTFYIISYHGESWSINQQRVFPQVKVHVRFRSFPQPADAHGRAAEIRAMCCGAGIIWQFHHSKFGLLPDLIDPKKREQQIRQPTKIEDSAAWLFGVLLQKDGDRVCDLGYWPIGQFCFCLYFTEVPCLTCQDHQLAIVAATQVNQQIDGLPVVKKLSYVPHESCNMDVS